MKMFLSQRKYEIIASVAVITTLYVLFYFVVPAAKSAVETFFMARSEIKMSESVQNADSSPDSLIAEYNMVSSRIQKYTNVHVNSSKILSFVHEVAGNTGVVLTDLSTGEMRSTESEIEIPVFFKTSAPFVDVLNFLKELENGMYCVRADVANLSREEKGISASVKFSVLTQNKRDSTKTAS